MALCPDPFTPPHTHSKGPAVRPTWGAGTGWVSRGVTTHSHTRTRTHTHARARTHTCMRTCMRAHTHMHAQNHARTRTRRQVLLCFCTGHVRTIWAARPLHILVGIAARRARCRRDVAGESFRQLVAETSAQLRRHRRTRACGHECMRVHTRARRRGVGTSDSGRSGT